MLVERSHEVGTNINYYGCKDETIFFMGFERVSSPMFLALGQQYNIGEKATIILRPLSVQMHFIDRHR